MSPNIKAVCVYCSASSNIAPHYGEEVKALGQIMAQHGWSLVFGGGGCGLMGAVADSVLSHGGKAVGIIPEHLKQQDKPQEGLTELFVVDTMHQRKQMMVDRSDAFVILPGGLGTLDEAFEILTWKQLKLHDKPVVLLNSHGYWDEFLNLIDKMIEEKFVVSAHKNLFSVAETVGQIEDILLEAPDERFNPEIKRI